MPVPTSDTRRRRRMEMVNRVRSLTSRAQACQEVACGETETVEGSTQMRKLFRLRTVLAILALMGLFTTAATAAADQVDEDITIARSLAIMLQAGRSVISRNQERINDASIGDKGLTGKLVLSECLRIYEEKAGIDPRSIDASSRHGRLLRLMNDSIVEVMNTNQRTINALGLGFKAFIPATFARLVTEEFGKRAIGVAEIKVTAPPDLVRNRKSRPDDWELRVIAKRLGLPTWPRGQTYAEVAETKGRQAVRVATPEYYEASCMSCHGGPKGEIDITGYPKEGASTGDLGGVISITLFR
jgi:hypothetical protein